jgi:type I restriction enzyme S subunit
LPTAALGSSQAPTAAVDKSPSASNTKIQTPPFAHVRKVDLPCLLVQRVARLRAKAGLDSRFLRYVIGDRHFTEYILSVQTGTAVPHISAGQIAAFEFLLPPMREQKMVGELLGLLDDRIDLLRQTNATLEAIAQALFKSWFVDFDPVRDKMDGREPEGKDAETAALFPDGFEESELGAIPRGWRVAEIGRCVDCVGGGTPSTKEPDYWEPAVHCWATPKDLSGLGAPVLLDTERRLSDKGIAKVSSGLLPVGTLLMSSRAPIGYLALAQVPLAVNQGFIAMKPGGALPPQYLYFWCKSNMDAIKVKANGSTFQEISKAAFRPIRLVLPPQNIVQRFADFSAAIFDRIAVSELHRRQLVDLRDTLQPRLISGKLRLSEVREQIEEATA